MSVHLETPILLIVVVIGLFCLWEVHCFQSKRYFTTHTVLDPLRRSRDHEGAPYSRGKFLDVWYTNDPATIDKWLKDNIPSSGHVTLGLDVEVRTYVDRPILSLSFFVVGKRSKDCFLLTRHGMHKRKVRWPNILFLLNKNRREAPLSPVLVDIVQNHSFRIV